MSTATAEPVSDYRKALPEGWTNRTLAAFHHFSYAYIDGAASNRRTRLVTCARSGVQTQAQFQSTLRALNIDNP